MPGSSWVSWRQEGQSKSQLADWERPAEGKSPQAGPPVEQHQPSCGRNAMWVVEENTACYGQEKILGKYSSLLLSPPISHSPQKHQPFWEYFFFKLVCFARHYLWLCFRLYLYYGYNNNIYRKWHQRANSKGMKFYR